jgi:hypothetical protein
MRQMGHIVHMGRGEVHMGFCWENLRERDHLEDPVIDRRIILEWIFRNWMGGWNELIWLKIQTCGRL